MKEQQFHLVISKVDELLFRGEAQSVTLPGSGGILTVLSHHEPLITLLSRGTIRVKSENGTEEFPIQHGLAEISKNQVTVLV